MARILIAGENAVIREGLKQILAANRDMGIAGEASTGQEVMDELPKNRYDVVLLDVSIPGRNWLDILKDLRNQKPNFPVVVLSAHTDEDLATRAFRAGASGYLTIECAPDELLTALKKVLSGGKYVNASLGEKLAFDMEKGADKLPHELLSDREYQVMSLLASGRTVSEIAGEMSLSVKTVSTYRSRILEKLNLKNNVELARYYTKFIDTQRVKCKRCGQDNPHIARFCAHCGGVLDTAAEPALPAPGPPIKPVEVRRASVSFWGKYRRIIGASAASIAIIVVGIMVWQNQPASTPYAVPREVELKYDDGTSEDTVSSSRGGYLVGFSPPSVPFVVNKIRMYGEAYSSERTEFDVQIWDREQNVLYSAIYPFTLFPPPTKGRGWVEVPVPDIEVKTDFFIHLYTGTGKMGGQDGVQLGADNSTRNKHSSLTVLTSEGTYKIRDGWGNYMQSMWFADKNKVTWMIRVVGGSPK